MVSEQVSNRLILHANFSDTIADLNKINIRLPSQPSPYQMDFQNYVFPPSGQLVTPAEEIDSISLDPKKGESFYSKTQRPIAAYDESINKFVSLEGTAFLFSHSLVVAGEEDFIPTSLLTFYFYTRSEDIQSRSKFITHSKDPESDSKKDYLRDKMDLLTEYTPTGSILFIDGPLIGGDVYTTMMGQMKRFDEKDIIPIFFVKNSSSNLVTDNIEPLKNRFNSDMHWSYRKLKPGQRTNFFKYADAHNPKNAKVFCYLKAFDLSPQRIEFTVGTYNRYKEDISDLLNLVYYLLLVQGNLRNPQIRPIAIAEKFARDTINLADISKLAREAGLVPTMNEGRGFAWG